MSEYTLVFCKVHFLCFLLHRGVAMAMKMPLRTLKKECAAILESMKVLIA